MKKCQQLPGAQQASRPCHGAFQHSQDPLSYSQLTTHRGMCTHTHTFSKRVPRAHAPTWAATHCLAEQFLTGSGIGMTLSYVAQLDNLFYFMVRMTTVHSGRDKMFSHFCRTTNLSQVKCLASQRSSGDFLHY